MEMTPLNLINALADDTRLRLTYLIFRHGEICVCDLVSALDTAQPKVSKHLGNLRSKEVIKGRREGQWIHYRINPEIPHWAGSIIEALMLGCESRSPYQEDERRLGENRNTLSCG